MLIKLVVTTMLTPTIHIIKTVAIMRVKSMAVIIKTSTTMTNTTTKVLQLLASNHITAKAAIHPRVNIAVIPKKIQRPSVISQ